MKEKINRRNEYLRIVNAKYFYLLLLIILTSCNFNKLRPTENESQSLEYEGNAINKTNPTLMIFPSDALLRRLGCINEIENQGNVSYTANSGQIDHPIPI